MKKKINRENYFWISKKCGISGQIRKPVVNEREFSDEKQIKKEVEKFYKTLFKDSVEITSTEYTLFLETLPLPILKEKEILLCQEDLLWSYDEYGPRKISRKWWINQRFL